MMTIVQNSVGSVPQPHIIRNAFFFPIPGKTPSVFPYGRGGHTLSLLEKSRALHLEARPHQNRGEEPLPGACLSQQAHIPFTTSDSPSSSPPLRPCYRPPLSSLNLETFSSTVSYRPANAGRLLIARSNQRAYVPPSFSRMQRPFPFRRSAVRCGSYVLPFSCTPPRALSVSTKPLTFL